ncbi:MAG TPA: uroporphyrinogen decarboxylase [Terriglobales bacterium]|nr:uroporphyrinogen decarboxylase [Terriglobales bacterium]
MTRKERFLAACRGERVDRPPVWLMRQAGRYMPEYRAVRAQHSLLEICHQPELAAEVTITAAERLGTDAAIIFADLLLPTAPLGMKLEFTAGEGPRITPPLRSAAQITALPDDWQGALGFVSEAIALVERHFAGAMPVLGFAGAPFTLASYLIEGGPSTQYLATRQMMRQEPAAWNSLLGKLVNGLADFCAEQAAAGAAAIQLFDSWVGTLAPAEYRQSVLPHVQRLVALVRASGVPVIYFSTATTGYLELTAASGADVLSLDWRVDMAAAWQRLQGLKQAPRALQGNLDPTLLLAPAAVREAATARLLESMRDKPGYIFNLGHGILPATPVEAVQGLVAQVQASAGC